MSAISSTLSAYPIRHPERCTRYRFRYSECDSCADACPHDALKLNDAGFELSLERCHNCGLCSTACPTGALQTENLPWRDWLELARKEQRLRIACAPSKHKAEAVAPCLGALDPVTLTALLTHRIEVELLGHEQCASCVHGSKGAEQLEQNLAAMALLRAAADDSHWGHVTLANAAPLCTEPQPQRRQFFRRLFGRNIERAVISGEESMPIPAMAIRAAAPFVPQRRKLLEGLLTNPQQGEVITLSAHPALPIGQPELDAAACTACEVCARVCPTNALIAGETATAWVLRLNSTQCVACGVCIEACHRHALHLRDTITVATATEDLRVVPRRRCERCGRLYVLHDANEQCPVCDDDSDSFSAIFG